jgi:solute carrier family 25 protein 38
MTGLTQLRAYMAQSSYFATVKKYEVGQSQSKTASVLPVLTMQGNLIAGATLRVVVGFLLNPFSVLKARYEVRVS